MKLLSMVVSAFAPHLYALMSLYGWEKIFVNADLDRDRLAVQNKTKSRKLIDVRHRLCNRGRLGTLTMESA